MDTDQSHVEPPPIPFMKENSTGNSYGYYVKLNICRDPTYSTFYLYEFRMYLFDHGETEEFLLFVKNFK